MERNREFDLMLFIGIIMVVLGHTYQPSWFYFPAYSFHMALFFFIAGYFFRIKQTIHDKVQWVQHKVKSQLVPYFLMNIVFTAIGYILNYYNLPLADDVSWYGFFVRPFIDGHQSQLFSSCWFLVQLFVANICMQLIFWSKNKFYFLIVFISSSLLNYYLLTIGRNPVDGILLLIVRTNFALFFMLIGLFFYQNEAILKKYLLKPIALFLLIAAIWQMSEQFGPLTYTIVYGNIGCDHIYLPLINSTLIILLTYVLCTHFIKLFSNQSFVYVIARNTFTIMVLHIPLIAIVKLILVILGYLYLGDIYVFHQTNIVSTWPIYLFPALLIPVFLAEKFKKITSSYDKN